MCIIIIFVAVYITCNVHVWVTRIPCCCYLCYVHFTLHVAAAVAIISIFSPFPDISTRIPFPHFPVFNTLFNPFSMCVQFTTPCSRDKFIHEHFRIAHHVGRYPMRGQLRRHSVVEVLDVAYVQSSSVCGLCGLI